MKIEAGDIIKRGDGIAEVKSVESDDYLSAKAASFYAWVHVKENYRQAVNANIFSIGLFAGMMLADVFSRILFDAGLFTGWELLISGMAIAAHSWCLLNLFRVPGAKR